MDNREQLLKDYKLAIDTGDTELEDAIAKRLEQTKELTPPSAFLSGVGGETLKSLGGIVDLFPDSIKGENPILKAGQEGIEKATGFAGGAGRLVGAAAPYFALPGGSLTKVALEQSALSGATTPGDLQQRAAAAGITGLVSGAAGVLPLAAKKAYDIASVPFTGDKNAARQIMRELERQALPTRAPSFTRPQPADMIGPPIPKFGRVPDVKPTAAMLTDDPRFVQLEMNARVRNPAGFFARDAANTGQAYKALEQNARSDMSANLAQDALNAKTGPMRDLAYKSANDNAQVFREKLLAYSAAKRQEPGFRESDGIPLLNRLDKALIKSVDPTTGKAESKSLAQDLYTLRKELKDKLNLKTLAPDELTNAAKSNRSTVVEITKQIDDALDEASGGTWQKYLDKHGEGMKPIEEGRSFQNILDKFETSKKVFGTDIPLMTPAALRKAADAETYMNLGKKGYVSTIGDTSRAKLNDVIDMMNKIEQARAGVQATAGSQTAPLFASLAKDGLTGLTGSPMVSKGLMALNALGVTRGKHVLDDALLNPERLQRVIDTMNAMQRAQARGNPALDRIRQYSQAASAGAINQ